MKAFLPSKDRTVGPLRWATAAGPSESFIGPLVDARHPALSPQEVGVDQAVLLVEVSPVIGRRAWPDTAGACFSPNAVGADNVLSVEAWSWSIELRGRGIGYWLPRMER